MLAPSYGEIPISKTMRAQKEAISQFKCKSSTISEAFKVLKRRKLIEETNAPDVERLENRVRGIKREKFYRLLSRGLLAFIDQNPSPREFWIAIISYCRLDPRDVDKTEFNRYYNLFIDKFVGNFPLRSCFFLGNFFEDLFQKSPDNHLLNNHYKILFAEGDYTC